MTDRKPIKRRKFAHEILGLIGISALFALVLFLLLINIAAAAAEIYCFENDIAMTEFDWMEVDRWIFGVGTVLSVSAFCILFLTLLGDRLTYVQRLTQGIDAMRQGQNCPVPLEGNNELTELAGAINYMSAARQQMADQEQALAQEKDQLVRTLSHDIRTPLTSILAYTEYLTAEEALPAEERTAHLQTVRKKAEQIRDLTDILLDGTKRNLEHFADARLLMEQLAEEFLEDLEDAFAVSTDLSGCQPFAGSFDVQELRRIFDNLSSNVRKYADPRQPVRLTICANGTGLTIRQSNAAGQRAGREEGYQLGIRSIRRIAQHYGGSAETRQDAGEFEIIIRLSDF